MRKDRENQTENHAFVSLKMFVLIHSLPFTFGSGQFSHIKFLFDIKCRKILQHKHRAANSHDQTVALFPSLPPCSPGSCCHLPCSQPWMPGPGLSQQRGRSIGHCRVTEVSPGCGGNACQGIDKQQICVTADAFLMACPEVQTLGLYPPASQPSAQQSLLLKQSQGCPHPASSLINASPSL